MATKMSHRECEKGKTKIRRKIGEGRSSERRTNEELHVANRAKYKSASLLCSPLLPHLTLISEHSFSWGYISYSRRETTLSCLSTPLLPAAFSASIYPLLPYFLRPPSSLPLFRRSNFFFHPAIIITLLFFSESLRREMSDTERVSILRHIINIF